MRTRSFIAVVAMVWLANCRAAETPTAALPAALPKRLELSLSLDPDRLHYTVELRNGTVEPLKFWDTISAGSQYTLKDVGPAKIRLESQGGQLISGNDIFEQGRWSFAYLQFQV